MLRGAEPALPLVVGGFDSITQKNAAPARRRLPFFIARHDLSSQLLAVIGCLRASQFVVRVHLDCILKVEDTTAHANGPQICRAAATPRVGPKLGA